MFMTQASSMESENWIEVGKLAQELLRITLETPVDLFSIEKDDRLDHLSEDERELWVWSNRREQLAWKLHQLDLATKSGNWKGNSMNQMCPLELFAICISSAGCLVSESNIVNDGRLEEQLEEKIDLLKSEIFHQSGRNSLEAKIIDRYVLDFGI
jgi:hypothetical protein